MRVRRLAFLVIPALAFSGGALVAPSVQAMPLPAVVPPLPQTVTSDVLPTPQINGVVWRLAIAGNSVYAGGQFTQARPFGVAAGGAGTVTRNNMLAYNLTTGALDTTFNPNVNGRINDVQVTPDGTKLVIGGNFTKVGTATRNRVAVFDLPSRKLSTTFVPNVNGQVKGVAVSNSTIFLAGSFSTINGVGRSRVGAVAFKSGTPAGVVTPMKLPAINGSVSAIVTDPGGTQVVFGGSFTDVGGSDHPGYGLYRARTTDGSMLPLPLNDTFRDAGANSGLYHLSSDGTNFYGTGWAFHKAGGTGNNEGYFQASWGDGSLVNLNDCHGDAYDVAPVGDVVYLASHSHNCITSGSIPQSMPYTYWHSSAWTKATAGTNGKDEYFYPDNPGTPSPANLPWFPTYQVGSYTGQNQAVWSVTGNASYVVYGGEFTRVNGIKQQGLVRFAIPSIAPKKVGAQPAARGTFTTRVRSFNPGEVRVSWPALWDRDGLTLTYHLFRNGTDVYQTSQDAFQWNGQGMTYTDNDPSLTAGSTPSYVVRAVDANGNTVSTPAASTTVTATATLDPYATQVLADGATKYWRLDDTGSTVGDLSGPDYPTAGTGLTRGTPGALIDPSDPTNAGDNATTFDGTDNGVVVSNNRIMAPNTFSEEIWFKTTTAGGTLATFDDGAAGGLFQRDRILYMDSTGAVTFGVKKNWVASKITSAAGLNDGNWHQAVATMGAGGMELFIDGVSVGTIPTTTEGEDFAGWWRIGGDTGFLWPAGDFHGDLDEFAIYPTALTAAQVASHWTASGR